jgi:hypothetical protein
MTTALSSIYGAFNSMSVQFSTDTLLSVHTWNYTDLDGSKQPACPQRILSCSGALEGGMGFIALGKLTSIDWTIVDTLLLKPALEGDSLKENSGNIVKYIDAYIGALRNLRAPSAQSHVTDCKFEPGVYYWPDDTSGTPYIGVKTTLTIQEVISG